MSPATTQSEIGSILTKRTFFTGIFFGRQKGQNTL
jgi:hypothetical protein